MTVSFLSEDVTHLCSHNSIPPHQKSQCTHTHTRHQTKYVHKYYMQAKPFPSAIFTMCVFEVSLITVKGGKAQFMSPHHRSTSSTHTKASSPLSTPGGPLANTTIVLGCNSSIALAVSDKTDWICE